MMTIFNLWMQRNRFYTVEGLLLIAGALLPFSFAPYGLFWLQFPLLAFLFYSCVQQTPWIAFRRGLLFGLGWFVHGIHWIFYSLHFHGGSPVLLAVVMVVMLAAVLSLFPATALYLANRFFKSPRGLTLLLVYPLLLSLFEWLRGYVLTGLPWVQLGIAHIDTPLAGYAPLIGGLGLGLIVFFVSALLCGLLLKPKQPLYYAALVMVYLVGWGLMQIQWTEPVGEPIKVSMIQGNIPQSEKWKRENYFPTLQMYRELTREHWDSDLIIWPETAVPGFKSRIPSYLQNLREEAEKTQTSVLLGVFIRNPQSRRYYNSVISLDGQMYQKRHLVPLGEYFPFRPLLSFFAQWINIPLSDIDEGPKEQPLIEAAGQKIGINICFEDVFDRDVLLDAPEATLLVNVSNDAWFEDSPQPWQHNQIARMRALETGRVLLRVTNTGVSSVIDAQGKVQAMLPQFKRRVLRASISGYTGSTPYVLWANYLLVSSALLVLGVLVWRQRMHSQLESNVQIESA